MKQKVVGVYCLGLEKVQVVLSDELGGGFTTWTDKVPYAVLSVGANKKWAEVVSICLHESLEFVMFRSGCRYENCNDMGNDRASYMFLMNHSPQFSDCCAKVAYFLTDVFPDLLDTWRAWTRKK